MYTLLIDTSNQMLSVAINQHKTVRAEINTNVKVNHSETLMHYIERLFDMARINKSDIRSIVIARGPGSYTGVRIGVTVAKVLASQWNVNLYSVSSLFVIAAASNGIVTPVIDARRGEVFAATYERGETIVDPQHTRLENALKFHAHAAVIGNSDEPIALNIEGFYHTQVRVSEVERFANQLRKEEVERFVPEYLKVSEAEAKWRSSQSEQ